MKIGAQDVAENFFKTAEEAVEYLFSEEFESEMIVLRPEVDELTDEEVDLRKSGFRATGTIRRDRIQHCPLEIDSIFKNTSRGSHDFYFDGKNKITAVKWNDNKCVTLATNFDIIEPLTSVSRSEKGKAAKNKIEQPCLLNNYNKIRGDVDSHDWLLEKHTIRIRGKKWYLPIITRIVGMVVANTCVVYNMVNAEKKSIKEVRRHIAIAYLKKGNTVQKEIGIASYTISSRVKEIDTVRRDGVSWLHNW
ncbi:piggyBac transposable element-derived protein 1 [Nephila pilipes]|uniref:PiggyBac transposable element-derived protein 1 n=1 Tax=Nephila pilipes TaxID=299642 RepID=A0A8X6UN02_NEPPI|nr:piggyBac transposable element-derived protein 1 [Nephila pilipes]